MISEIKYSFMFFINKSNASFVIKKWDIVECSKSDYVSGYPIIIKGKLLATKPKDFSQNLFQLSLSFLLLCIP